ncbi:methyltransferase (DUF5641) [Popillia japonica]|uniref:Methyltransferase (DUF5641) n=1 Tax=Popillia japonica TaxID=7064 RepID=A0AAW1JDV7_POPJA
MNRLTRYQHLQQLHQNFWSRWSKEYLHHLQQRYKWKLSLPSSTVGTLVLIKEDNLPPYRWMLGRIIKLHPGTDGINRVVTLKTIKGVIKRPVTKICPLPLQNEVTDTSLKN